MAADQVTAVKHALLSPQYVALAERTRFPVPLLQELAEQCDFDLTEVEAGIGRAMQAVSDAVMAASERQLFTGGNAGGGKEERLRAYMGQPRGIIQAPRGIVTTCVA